MPPRRAIREATDQTMTLAVGLLSARGSGGQLLVGVVVAGALGGAGPGGPGEERGQLVEVLGVGDRVGPQAVARWLGEEVAVVGL